MHPTALWRLVWKDARTLLPVWLVVFSMVVVMQLAMLVYAALDNRPAVNMTDMATVAACLCIPLAIATGTMQFAGESESNTDEWLRQLPVHPWLLGSQKMLTALAAIAIYVGAALGAGFILTRGKRWDHTDSIFFDAVGLAIALFAWCTFFALLRARVIPAVTLGIIVGVFFAPLIYFGSPDIELFDFGGTNMAIGPAVLCIDFALAVRWAKGRIPPLRSLESARLPRIALVWQPLLEQSVVSRDPVLRWLYTLLWKETCSAVFFALWWGILGIAIAFAGIPVFYILLTPLAAGFVAFVGDNSRETQQFLGHRGIPPSLVWLSRNAVWMTTAFALMLGWSLLDHYKLHAGVEPTAEGFALAEVSALQFADAIRIHYPDGFPYGPASAADRLYQASWFGSLVMGLYAFGLMCGIWFRRPVVGAAVAFAGFIFVWLWHGLILKAGIPLWLTTWPLPILWLAATWRGCEHWLIVRTEWGRQSAWMFLPGVFVLAMFPIARYHQIPEVDVSLDEIEARWMDYDEEQTREWRELADDASQMYLKYTGNNPWSEADSLTFAERIRDVATMEPHGRWSLAPEQWLAGQSLLSTAFSFADRRGWQLRERGRLREELDLYVDTLLLNDRVAPLRSDDLRNQRLRQLTLFGFIADWANDAQQSDELLHHALDRVYTGSHSWYVLGQRGIRAESLDNRDVQTMAENSAALSRQMMRGEGEMFDIISQQDNTTTSRDDYLQRTRVPGLLRGIYYATGEYTRYERLLAAMAVDARSDGSIDRAEFDRWVAATPEFKNDNEFYERTDIRLRYREPVLINFDAAVTEQEERNLEMRLPDDRREVSAAFRFAVLTIALQIHRHEFGEFPMHLTELRSLEPHQLRMAMFDPYSNSDGGRETDSLQWYPAGLPGPVFIGDPSTSNGRSVSSRQPLLVSCGREDRSLHFESFAAHGVADVEPSRGAFHDGRANSAWKFQLSLGIRPEPPFIAHVLTYEDGPPDVVASLILGPAMWGKYRQQGWRTPEDEASN